MSHATARGLANAIIEAANRAAAALDPLSAQRPTITVGVSIPVEVIDALAELVGGERSTTCWLEEPVAYVIESVRWEVVGVALTAQGTRPARPEDAAGAVRRAFEAEKVSAADARAALEPLDFGSPDMQPWHDEGPTATPETA